MGAGIFLFARRAVGRAGRRIAPRLDLLGSVLWALGMGLTIYRRPALLRVGLAPTGRGSSLVARGVAGRLADPRWTPRDPAVHGRTSDDSTRPDGEPLVTPSLFGNRRMTERADHVLLPVHRDDGACSSSSRSTCRSRSASRRSTPGSGSRRSPCRCCSPRSPIPEVPPVGLAAARRDDRAGRDGRGHRASSSARWTWMRARRS